MLDMNVLCDEKMNKVHHLGPYTQDIPYTDQDVLKPSKFLIVTVTWQEQKKIIYVKTDIKASPWFVD